MTAHSKIGASGAKRWMSCPASYAASKGLPEQRSSKYAKEGTAAHKVAEECLRDGRAEADDFIGSYREVEGERFEVTAEMARAVNVYLDAIYEVLRTADELHVELKLSVAHIHPDMFGTSDCVIYSRERRALYVFDFKYGAGVAVGVKDNPQALYYAVGAVAKFAGEPIDRIIMVVVQPRAGGDPVKIWEIDRAELWDWENGDLRPAVARLFEADAPFVAGDHCRWCPVAPNCKAFETTAKRAALDGLGRVVDPTTLAAAELGDRLAMVETLLVWCKTIKEHAEAEAAAGRMPIGFKHVQGRSTRYFAEDDSTRLVEMFGEEIVFEHSLVSPAKLEKAVGKKLASEAAHLVRLKPGGIQLVPVTDERPDAKAAAAHGFRAVPENLDLGV